MGGSPDFLVLTVAAAPSVAMAWTYLAMAHSLELAMGNAVSTEKNMQIVAATATTVVCAKIVGTMK